jgi:hypothetical protein
VDPGSQFGMVGWTVDRQEQEFSQWFWYRIGNSGGESSINTISAAVITQPDARTLDIVYNNGSLSVEVDYLLTGGLPGSGKSDVSESIRINNLTDAGLDFHFFEYSDFDLTSADTTVLRFGPNQFFVADQRGEPGGFQETVVTPAANHAEAAIFPLTMKRLNDANPTTLNDNTTAGPGDTTYAFEWDFTLGARSSFLISNDESINIPEPSPLALFFLGLIALGLKSRRK